jgi:hypothetical protein
MWTSSRHTGKALIGALVLSLLAPQRAFSHSVTVDGSSSDWWGVLPPVANLARVNRNHAREGEFVWYDASNDTRTALGSAGLDLTSIRITSDFSRLYVMATLRGTPVTSGTGAPQLQIALDFDQFPGLGSLDFVDGARTQISSAAAWEYLLQTGFGSGAGAKLYDSSLNPIAAPLQEALSPAGVIEVSVPWSSLGRSSPPVDPVRFTIALFAATANDSVFNADTTGASNAIDVLSDSQAPGTAVSTSVEVADGVVNDYRDLYFNPSGEVYAPVVLSEIYYAGGVNDEWIEVVNATPGVVSLDGYKVGDEETPGGNEGMGQLPSNFLTSAQTFVIARNGATFFAQHGFHANAEATSSDPGTPDLTPFPAWASSPAMNIMNGGDEVLVLDGSNTVVDVFTFHNGTWPGVTPAVETGPSHSAERIAWNLDTDDCSIDFTDEPSPNPETVSSPTAVGAEGFAPFQLRGPFPNPVTSSATFALQWAGGGLLRADCVVLDLAGRRVRRLDPGAGFAGSTTFAWDARDDAGRRVTPGLYFLRVTSPLGSRTVRCAVVGR